MSTVIKAEDLGKKYILRHQKQERYTSLREEMTRSVKKWGQRVFTPFAATRESAPTHEEFWALQNVFFEIKQGDRVGIIGRNGAGKSTLLKILSRITEPTTGRISIKGRVASLLEVGTGFHPELTGRENIYLNGAILGMSKVEIKKKFDAIVDFAEVEKFLDTPVKRYSSGMYVRLAFAVAAHLEPEILVVDEVLAVGDMQFQKKCLGKMDEVGKDRTVLFVSHQMPMIASLCNKTILLHQGNVLQYGPTATVIQRYYSSGLTSTGEVDFTKSTKKIGDDTAHILAARLLNRQGQVVTDINIDQDIIIEMEYAVSSHGARVTPNYHVYTSDGSLAFVTSDAVIDPEAINKKQPGNYLARCLIPGNFLNDGTYYIGFALSTLETSTVHFFQKDLLQVTVIDSIEETVTRGRYVGLMPGIVRPALNWESEKLV